MVAQPTFSGLFNPNLSPIVRIDEHLADATQNCGETLDNVATFTMTTGPGSETIRVNTVDQYYILNWHAADFGLLATCTYRIRALLLVSGQEFVLGIADVDVVNNGAGLKNVQTGEFIGLVDNRTLPIKFRVELVIPSCTPGRDCVVAVVGDQGGTVISPNQRAGIDIPDAATDINRIILIEELPPERPCFPTSALATPQFDECYLIQSIPDVPFGDGNLSTLEDNYTAGICVELPATMTIEQARRAQVFQFEPDEPPSRTNPQALQNVPAPFLPCNEPSNGTVGLWQLLRDGLAALVLPRPVYAAVAMVDFGVGGSGTETSHFTWSLPSQMAVNDGNGQTAAPGATLPTSPSVIVTDFGSPPVPVAGVTVTFSVAAGNGTITGPVAVTGADGIARVGSWTLPSTAGTFTLTASAPAVLGSPLNLTATAVPADLVVESFTHSPADPTTADQITFTAVVKNVGTGSAGASTLEFRIGGETPGTPQTRFAVPALGAGQTFTVQRQMVLSVAQNYINTATADVNNEVVESNEANNQRQDFYTVGLPPDLIVESLTHSPAAPTTADQITFTAVVKNVGTGSARASTLEFRIGGETPGTRQTRFPVPALGPGQTFTVQRQMVLSVAQNYINTAIADVDNEVGETNEANNQRQDFYTVARSISSFAMDVVAGNTGVLEQACPAGTSPTGGGFHFPNSNLSQGPDVIVIESSPRVTVTGTTGWRVVANNRTGVTQRMEVWVVCAANLSGYAVRSFGQDVVAGNTGVLEQACPAGTSPTGGGFHFPNSNLSQGPDVIVIESSPRVTVTGTTGWRVVANNRTAVTQPMEVWVACAANLSGYEVLSFGFDVAAGNTGVLERACPAGKNPTGGGFHFPNSNLIQGPDVIAIESSPRVTVPGTTGWRVVANNRTGVAQRMEVWVACAGVSS